MHNKQPIVEVIEPKLFAGTVADEIAASLGEFIAEKGSASLVLAGGKTPGAIYRQLGLPPRVHDIEWGKVHLFWGDERWVPQEDSQSNYRMVKETLLDHMRERLNQKSTRTAMVHAVPFSQGDPDEAAKSYEDDIRRCLKIGPNDAPVFDLVLLGVGEDGHTASLFPQSSSVAEEKRLVLAVNHPTGAKRITFTPRALFSARKIFYLVSGENKAEIMKKILSSEGTEAEHPAKLYARAAQYNPESRVTFLLDSGAAKLLPAHLKHS